MTLEEFLTAQLDKDEQLAREAVSESGEHWEGDNDALRELGTGGSGYIATGPYGCGLGAIGPHIARHDPARVLRQVEAQRQILRDYEQGVFHGEDILRILAAAWSDHPGYREAWGSAAGG